MKKSLIKISLFSAVFILSSFAPASKIKYTSAEGKLEITFPTAFDIQDMSTENYSSIQAKADLDDQLFFMTYNIHTTELSDHEGLAETSLSSFTEALHGEITSRNTWQVKKNKGLKAKLKIEEYDLVGDYGVVIVGQIQYQVAVVSATDKWNQARSDAFFKSFKIKN